MLELEFCFRMKNSRIEFDKGGRGCYIIFNLEQVFKVSKSLGNCFFQNIFYFYLFYNNSQNLSKLKVSKIFFNIFDLISDRNFKENIERKNIFVLYLIYEGKY